MSVPPATTGSGLTYDLIDPPAWLSGLTVREARLLDGALTFHCLVRPGRLVRATVLRPVDPDFPALTDETTSSIEWPDGRAAIGSVLASATGVAPRDDDLPTDVVVDLGAPQVGYHLRGGGTPVGRLGTVRHAVRARVPVAFDALRQRRTDRIEAGGRPVRSRGCPAPSGAVRAPAAAPARRSSSACTGSSSAAPRAGPWRPWPWPGEAGLLPIVVTDRPSGHPDIDRATLDGALVIPLTTPMAEEHESRLLAELFTRFDIRGVHVHHCTWLYQRLPWIRTQYPDTDGRLAAHPRVAHRRLRRHRPAPVRRDGRAPRHLPAAAGLPRRPARAAQGEGHPRDAGGPHGGVPHDTAAESRYRTR